MKIKNDTKSLSIGIEFDSFDEKDIERGAGDFIYRRSRPDTGALVRKKSDSG